jgi:selenocysteine lyase/cysteine desulfurase
MYAPFGAGALVGPREIFLQGAPEYQGGGTVELVTLGYVRWAELPDREEAGSPNVVGAIAMAMAAQAMMDVGMESVERHETALTAYALDRLRSLPEIIIYGEADPRRTQERVGVISFNLGSANHALVAAVLGYEGGIGVRSGCFCAQPYVASMLRDAKTKKAQRGRDPLAGDNSGKPGMVRISFGAYNSFDDVDALVEMLRRITRNEYQGRYCPIPESGEYAPAGHRDSMADYFDYLHSPNSANAAQ